MFFWKFCVIFRRTLFTEQLRMIAPADYLVLTKVLFSDNTSSFFPSFYPFITDNCNYRSLFRVRIKMKIFFSFLTIIYPKINMLLRQFRLDNNLPTHIRENTDFLLGKASEIAECRCEFRRLWLARLGSKKRKYEQRKFLF